MMRHKPEMLVKRQLPPDVINDEMYSVSPLAAMMRKLTSERNANSVPDGTENHLADQVTQKPSLANND